MGRYRIQTIVQDASRTPAGQAQRAGIEARNCQAGRIGKRPTMSSGFPVGFPMAIWHNSGLQQRPGACTCFPTQRNSPMSGHDIRSAVRPDPDQPMVDIANYIADYVIDSPEAYATARRISQGAPLVASWHKQWINRLLSGEPLSDEEKAASFAFLQTEDYKEGLSAFFEKRKPVFKAR